MKFFTILALIAVICCAEKTIAQRLQPVDYVNPYIGTDKSEHLTVWESKGATFPGVLAPFGMVQITPDAYMYTDKKISCFSFLNHNSGWSSGGSFKVMAGISRGDDSMVERTSAFHHATEKTTPYYYRVMLDDFRIKAEFTATQRAAYCRFTFPRSGAAEILLSDIDEARVMDNKTIVGRSAGYYFIAKFNKAFKSCSNSSKEKLSIPSPRAEKGTGDLLLNYSTSDNELIDARIGFSTSSYEAAEKNLESEVPDWDFVELTLRNKKLWNDALKRIEVKGGTDDQKTIFYTALYHSLFMPCVQSDAGVPINTYTNLYPWDTYRSKHPLFNIIEPERQGEMIASVLGEYDKTGWLPAGNMMGNHNIELILDSYLKGIRNFDVDKALTAMRKSVMESPYARREMTDFVQYGYVPSEITSSVTHTLEFAYNDWALAKFIQVTGNEKAYQKDIDTLLLRARSYSNLFNANTGFMTAKSKAGDWAEGGYCEGTEWTWSWSAPHDINGLINLMGGKNKFSKKLTECFNNGHYVHDNEPPLHYAYLFNFTGEAWKTQKWSRKILEGNYSNTPGGLPGNDDLGALSSWYVLSAMGFYPVTPGQPIYEIGSPVFSEIIIHLSNGKDFTIKANNNTRKNVFIQSANINGKPLNQSWFSHEDIINGKTLVLNMGAVPNRKWASDVKNVPPSMTTGTPDFYFSDMQLSAKRIGPDKPFNLSVIISNKGDAGGTAELIVSQDGKLMETMHEVLKAGETRRFTYPIKLYRSGIHSISINKLKPQQLTIESTRAVFIYSELKTPRPAILTTNDSFRVTATVRNTGSAAGTTYCDFFIDAKKAQQQQIFMQPGEERLVQFLFKKTLDGCYEVGIGNLAPLKVRVIQKGQKYTMDPSLSTRLKAALVFNFDEGQRTTAKDLSSQENNAVVVGNVKWVEGLFGKAIQADASQNAFLQIPANAKLDSISIGKTLTMMCWVYPMDEENFADIFSKGDWNTLQLKGGNSIINYYTGGWEGHESSASVPAQWNRHWHHLAGVTEDGYLRLYVDGNLAATKKAEPRNPKGETGSADYSNAPWNIGRNAGSTERVFKGYIDDVMLFEKALTQKEIFEIMMHIKN